MVDDLRIDAIMLAAGQSKRMGAENKLLARFDDEPLIARSAKIILASQVSSLHVVTGYAQNDIVNALSELNVNLIDNPDYQKGMGTSLSMGIRALDGGCDGALIALGDMPAITTQHINQLIAAFKNHHGLKIIRASAGDKVGNPTIIPKQYFEPLRALDGDEGARQLIKNQSDQLKLVDIGEACLTDVDTPEAMAKAGGKF